MAVLALSPGLVARPIHSYQRACLPGNPASPRPVARPAGERAGRGRSRSSAGRPVIPSPSTR
jgi:hypothetical protein